MKIPLLGKKVPDQPGRRRPASGSQPPAFSYYSRSSTTQRGDPTPRRRPDLDSENLIGRRPSVARSLSSRFGLIIALIVLLVSFIHVMSLSASIKVAPLSDASSGYFLRDTSAYQTSASKLFKKSVLNRNKLTFNAGAIEAGMKAQYPELADVAITLPLIGTRPIMYIQPTQPAVVLETAQNKSYVVDGRGTALLVAGSQAVVHNLPIVHDQSGLPATIGKTVLASSSVGFIQTVVRQLNAHHVTIGSLTLPAHTQELDVAISGQPFFVKFNLATTDAAQQAGAFIAVQQKLAGQGITPASYIDVRVDGRAYYK